MRMWKGLSEGRNTGLTVPAYCTSLLAYCTGLTVSHSLRAPGNVRCKTMALVARVFQGKRTRLGLMESVQSQSAGCPSVSCRLGARPFHCSVESHSYKVACVCVCACVCLCVCVCSVFSGARTVQGSRRRGDVRYTQYNGCHLRFSVQGMQGSFSVCCICGACIVHRHAYMRSALQFVQSVNVYAHFCRAQANNASQASALQV